MKVSTSRYTAAAEEKTLDDSSAQCWDEEISCRDFTENCIFCKLFFPAEEATLWLKGDFFRETASTCG